MGFPRGAAAGLACLAAWATAAFAQDDDLARIPKAATETPPADEAQPADYTLHLYVQNDVMANTARGGLVVPLAAEPSWEERLFLDARLDWAIAPDFHFVYSGRFNLRAGDELGFPDHENVRNDLREAYFAWQIDEANFLKLGRINLKSGVGYGFNPTDFFKTRAVVEPLSADPSVLREDRLGTLMLSGQHIWDGGSLLIAVAPRLFRPTPLYSDLDLPSFDPMLDRTNAQTRILAKLSLTVSTDFVPELVAYHAGEDTNLGLNLTHAVGQAVVTYAEWSGGWRGSLLADALAYGRDTGTLPTGFAFPIPVDDHRFFRNDLAVGATYTTPGDVSFDLEYEFHEAGLSPRDWKDWFATGAAEASLAYVPQELWYIRGYATEQQEPVGRNEIFFRVDWTDAFVKDLELTGFVLDDLRDASGLAQLTADYYLTPDWTIGALVDVDFGGRRSDYGSLPETTETMLKITRYF